MTDSIPTLEAALAHHRSGRLAEAEKIYRQILAQHPDNADALHLLGVLSTQRGDPNAGLQFLREAVRRRPEAPIFHNNLGKALADTGDLAASAASHERAIELEPRYAEAHYNLGVTMAALGNKASAEQAYRRVLNLTPADFRARNNLAVVLQDLGRLDEAEECLRAVLEAQPADAEALVNLGGLYRLRGNTVAAVEHYRRALAAQPNLAKAHAGLGAVASAAGDIDAADAALRRALELAPDNSFAGLNHAYLQMVLDQFPSAWSSYRQVLKHQPTNILAQRNSLLAALYDPSLDAAARAAEHVNFGRAMAARVTRPLPSPTNDRNPDRLLRVGWLSCDFKHHPVARNLQPIFAALDPQKVATICFSDVPTADATTDWFRAAATAWHSTLGLDDEGVAKLIRSEKIDVMVFLAGRFDTNRPQVAAWRPAPVQVSFHDPATSGLATMDYLIADPVLVPPRAPEYFTERVVRLPSYYIHAPLAEGSAESSPAESAGGICFGSFNNPAKINDRTLAVWAEILRRLPTARLLLKYQNWFDSNLLRDRIRHQLGAEAARRIDFHGARDSLEDHMSLYRQVDIALDTFPFTGSTTTFEALSMGVPVVTLAGENMAARWSASILHALKLDDLIAGTPEDYVKTAVALANDKQRLAELRGTLRARIASSPLCDGKLRARQMERLFRAVWRRWCSQSPSSRPG